MRLNAASRAEEISSDAEALGLTIPPSLLLRADRVIEGPLDGAYLSLWAHRLGLDALLGEAKSD